MKFCELKFTPSDPVLVKNVSLTLGVGGRVLCATQLYPIGNTRVNYDKSNNMAWARNQGGLMKGQMDEQTDGHWKTYSSQNRSLIDRVLMNTDVSSLPSSRIYI